MNAILDGVAAVGRGAIGACRVTGALALFAVDGLSHLLRPPFYWRMFGRALLEIGYFSLPVVALTAIFTGMVLAPFFLTLASTEHVTLTSRSVAVNSSRLSPARSRTWERIGRVFRVLTTFCTDCKPWISWSFEMLRFMSLFFNLVCAKRQPPNEYGSEIEGIEGGRGS